MNRLRGGAYVPSAFDWVRDQVERYERTGGRDGGTTDGRPVVILTTVGARTGFVRKSAVMRLEADGVYAVVGSVGGLPNHPAWYHNLRADPHCELQDGSTRRAMIAREATGAEYDRWWTAARAAYPHYADLQARTERTFPIVLLAPV